MSTNQPPTNPDRFTFDTPGTRLFHGTPNASRWDGAPANRRQPRARPNWARDVFLVTVITTFRVAIERWPAALPPTSALKHVRVVGLAWIVLSPVYALAAWAVTASVWAAVLAPGVILVAYVAHELVRLSLWVLVYPGDGDVPRLGRTPAPLDCPAVGSRPSMAVPAPAQPALPPAYADAGEFVREVDLALRHLNEYAWLSSSPLVKTLAIPGETHLERGKALRKRLDTAIEALRPDGPAPKAWVPREWQGYLVLRLAYVEDAPNREIMARLCLAESTFSRLRRKAVQAVAQSVLERGG